MKSSATGSRIRQRLLLLLVFLFLFLDVVYHERPAYTVIALNEVARDASGAADAASVTDRRRFDPSEPRWFDGIPAFPKG